MTLDPDDPRSTFTPTSELPRRVQRFSAFSRLTLRSLRRRRHIH
jgi:hypothetical protein